jgi:hypothetical protein
MYCSDTDTRVPVVRLPHLRIASAKKLDDAIAEAKRVVSGNAYVLVKLSGGNIDSAQPLLPIKSD